MRDAGLWRMTLPAEAGRRAMTVKRFVILCVGCSAALAAPVLGRTVMVGTAPLVHPSGGQYAGSLNIDFTEGWWDERHSGALEGSGFAWVYEPVAFGEGLSKTFKIDNVFEPNLTKVLTITLKVRAKFMPDPGEIIQGPCRDFDFWGCTQVVADFTPFVLLGASNIGFNDADKSWSGQFQYSERPQPGAEFVTFHKSSFPADVVDILSMALDVSCVPEPASWGMMLAGFGVVGVSARRRRSKTVAATG
jgi:hypothetical protein